MINFIKFVKSVKFIENIFIIFFVLIFLSYKAFPQKSVIIFKSDCYNNYMNYAVYDLLIKNIFLYSNLKIVEDYSNYSDYKKIKSQIKKLTADNNAYILVAYDISDFKDGFFLNYIIFNKEKPNEWIEKTVYSKEEDLFISINKILKDICYSSNNDSVTYIEEKDYIPLIGYYSQKIISNNKDIYKLFYDFYKDNIYFNIDYLEYLTDKPDNAINDLVKNMPNYISRKNHYYFYSLGNMYCGKYKVDVVFSDIEDSIENYKKALELKNNYYKYYYRLANAYILKNDYENAVKNYEEAVKLNDRDINIIKELIALLRRDMNKNGNDVINYFKKIIEIKENDEETLEELSKLYESIGDYENALTYYNKLLDAVNFNITNNETKYSSDSYISKRNSIRLKIKNLENIVL